MAIEGVFRVNDKQDTLNRNSSSGLTGRQLASIINNISSLNRVTEEKKPEQGKHRTQKSPLPAGLSQLTNFKIDIPILAHL